LMKLMRLLRVLRLVRVLRSIPPLYTLLVGVIAAFKSMQWVLVLTLLVLYGASIIFTNLVGKGLIYGSDQDIPQVALDVYGTVGKSLFALFELMNGDTSVIQPIKDLVLGRLIFAGFMVISNWAILAILTAVVSDNMLASSTRIREEDSGIQVAKEEEANVAKLLYVFQEHDPDRSGSLDRAEWMAMLDDRATMVELSEDTHLSKSDLLDLFDCLAIEGEVQSGTVKYTDLVHSLKANSALADKRSVLHVMLRMRIMQEQMTTQLRTGFDEMKQMVQDGSVTQKVDGSKANSKKGGRLAPTQMLEHLGVDAKREAAGSAPRQPYLSDGTRVML